MDRAKKIYVNTYIASSCSGFEWKTQFSPIFDEHLINQVVEDYIFYESSNNTSINIYDDDLYTLILYGF